jgi:hypothetical protein
MNARSMLHVALALWPFCIPGMAAAAVTAAPEMPAMSPSLLIYLARGAADACGQGCDRWIAIEGKVDGDAASRIRKFLRGMKDARRPIYFHSPGGDVRQAQGIGRLLRTLKVTARVGRTVVSGCAADTPFDEACLKIKAGAEVEAAVATRWAMCNSACVYMLLAATTREVAPDAAVGVHHSRMVVSFRGHPTAQQRAEATARSRDRADSETAAYVKAMGISHDLVELTRSVPFEKMHLLTRPELFRFGIDPRPHVETAWAVEHDGRPFLRKTAWLTIGQGPAFRNLEWRLYCNNGRGNRLLFMREVDKDSAATTTVSVTLGSERSPAFASSPSRFGIFQVWSAAMSADDVKKLSAAPRLQVGETVSVPEGPPGHFAFEIETAGLETARTQLAALCATAPAAVARPVVLPAPAAVAVPYLAAPFPGSVSGRATVSGVAAPK